MVAKNSRSPRVWKLRGKIHETSKDSLTSSKLVINYPVKTIRSDFSRNQIEDAILLAYTNASKKQISAHTGQIFTAINNVKPKDLVIVPTQKGKFFTIGIVEKFPQISLEGDICFHFTIARKDIPISIFDQDLRYSFMAIMKICEVKRNNASERIMSIANGTDDPGFL